MWFPGRATVSDKPKKELGVRRAMALPVVPVAPGWAAGPVHRVDDPLAWASGRGEPEVLALPALWWPPAHRLPTVARAVLLYGAPPTTRTRTGLPVVAGLDADLVRERERVEVNGSKGTLTIEGVEEVRVVTAFLERPDGLILLLQRSEKVGSFRGRWAGVSGYLEDPTPLDQVYRELKEEVGLDRGRLALAAAGAPVLARDARRVFVVHPFRFRVADPEIRLDWEHVRAEWVEPAEIRRRPTVPKLDRAWEAVAPDPAPKG